MGERTKRSIVKKGSAKGMSIAILASLFNKRYTSRLLRSTLRTLKGLGAVSKDLAVEWVPGALELPLAAKLCAQTGKFEAVICLGAVLRGETSHYDLVCAGAVKGVVQAGLDTGVPVLFGVITCDTAAQAYARCSGGPKDAGKHAAQGAVKMIQLARRLEV